MERTVTVDEYVDRSIAAPKTQKKLNGSAEIPDRSNERP